MQGVTTRESEDLVLKRIADINSRLAVLKGAIDEPARDGAALLNEAVNLFRERGNLEFQIAQKHI